MTKDADKRKQWRSKYRRTPEQQQKRREYDARPESRKRRSNLDRARYANNPEYRQRKLAQARKWKEQNPDKRRGYALAEYSMSPAEYDALAQRQHGLCAICGRKPCGRGRSSRLHVDHDHVTGKVRGLLCNNCNRGIGLLGDDHKILLQAASYLTHPILS